MLHLPAILGLVLVFSSARALKSVDGKPVASLRGVGLFLLHTYNIRPRSGYGKFFLVKRLSRVPASLGMSDP